VRVQYTPDVASRPNRASAAGRVFCEATTTAARSTASAAQTKGKRFSVNKMQRGRHLARRQRLRGHHHRSAIDRQRCRHGLCYLSTHMLDTSECRWKQQVRKHLLCGHRRLCAFLGLRGSGHDQWQSSTPHAGLWRRNGKEVGGLIGGGAVSSRFFMTVRKGGVVARGPRQRSSHENSVSIDQL